SLVSTSTTANTGTDNIGANRAGSPVTTCAARMTRFPVMCAVNSPPKPRKLITSALPAIRLSKVGSVFVASEPSSHNGDKQTVRSSTSTDTAANHLSGIVVSDALFFPCHRISGFGGLPISISFQHGAYRSRAGLLVQTAPTGAGDGIGCILRSLLPAHPCMRLLAVAAVQ